jgi:hypothetical protein
MIVDVVAAKPLRVSAAREKFELGSDLES